MKGMDLILWRHAEAEDGHGKPDSDRELTKRGRKQAERMAHWLRPLVDAGWRVLCSPAKRTLQTVGPLGREFEESEAVGLDATASSILDAAGWPDAPRPVLVVGHQPTLGQVAARLIGGTNGDLAIRKGAIWWFTTRERDGGHETVLKAVLDPDLLGD
jgi:phosphohistidine phosphatase